VATCVLTGPQALLAEHDTDTIRARYPGSTGYRPSSTAAAPPRCRRPAGPLARGGAPRAGLSGCSGKFGGCGSAGCGEERRWRSWYWCCGCLPREPVSPC
jgi:hypothetical protein